jgi:hypothetical protein
MSFHPSMLYLTVMAELKTRGEKEKPGTFAPGFT